CRPFSVSSLAGKPPLIPVPTTMASNEFESMVNLAPLSPRHYGLRPRFAGSVSIHEPDPRRGVLAAAHDHGHGDGRVRHVRAALLDDLDLQVQLCTPGGSCGWHFRAAGDEHGHTESARDSPMGAARARAGRRVLLQSDRRECGNRARRLVLSFAARNRWRAWCRPVLVSGPESADAL